jgi:acyl-[acyl-carrier-protein]-phospholipid O-acyltransferase/long-chain-fatty-acid--[acyl-carrier-protein] ligase
MNVMMSIVFWALLALAVLVLFLISLRWWVQRFVRAVLALRYRLIIIGREHIPRTGPVLVACNHLSWVDGFFLAGSCPRRGKALVGAAYLSLPVLGHWLRWIGMIPVPFSGPKAQRAVLQVSRKILDEGGTLGIFPEAQISRNGLTGAFHRGIEVIVSGREQVVVIPTFLDGVWGSFFSFQGGRFFGKWPRGLRRTVIVAFGPPVSPPITAFSVRQAVLESGVKAFEQRKRPSPPLETIDPDLPHLDHSLLGPLCASTADFDRDGVRQAGQKPGTVGHPLPGVALRVVDGSGEILPPDAPGRLFTLVAGHDGWTDAGWIASIDRDGFVRIVDS